MRKHCSSDPTNGPRSRGAKVSESCLLQKPVMVEASRQPTRPGGDSRSHVSMSNVKGEDMVVLTNELAKYPRPLDRMGGDDHRRASRRCFRVEAKRFAVWTSEPLAQGQEKVAGFQIHDSDDIVCIFCLNHTNRGRYGLISG